ncbi:MAG TPA: hypothetical protein VH206_12530 [Xanthobacteraceae bacterium]|jgi:hypothetical protein|nr:hypothetical protein [Xanthobacteraceae bacterium]
MLLLVSSTGTYAPASGLAASATTNGFVAVVILVLFVLAAVISAVRKDITQGFDEVAHTSYVAQLQAAGESWPELTQMRMIDPQSFQFTATPNYLNHPPVYYALIAALGPALIGHPQALIVDRLIDVAIAALGFAALLGLGLAARLTRQEFYAYAVPLACIPVLVPIAGAVNNDNLTFFGGAVAMLGAWQRIATGRDSWLLLAFVGLIIASWAKLTGLLLTAGFINSVVVYLMLQGKLAPKWLGATACALVIAAAPYVVFIWHYGSPTPETPAQIALITDGARAAGWADLPRQSFPLYLMHFIGDFIADWMPVLGERSRFNYAMLVLPIAAVGCALAGIALSLRRIWQRRETPLDVMIVTATAAIAATFAIHVTYSYGRYVATGWLMDAYPRYYLPLIAFVPLACLSTLTAIQTPRWRNALLALLIAGPVLFRILGAPLG